MEMIDIWIVIPLVTFVTYLAYIYRRFGVLTSISASSTYLQGSRQALFTGFCWILALSIFFLDMGMIGAVAAGGLFFTGVTVNHDSDVGTGKDVHRYASISAIALLFIAIIASGNIWIPIAFIITCLPVLKRENVIWWVEVFAFAWIFFYLIIR